MATSSVRNHPNFAVICSFLQRYGEQLRLPDLTIPELEEVLEETNSVGHGLKELIIALMKRVVNSIKPDRWEKHLIKLIDNYHSPIDAWELESLGFSLCKLETKLSILKYLCETQFDDNPKFKNLVNKENPEEQKLKPIGRDKLGLVYWFQKDHECNIRIYREEQDDIDETTWQTIGRNREDLVNLISDLKVSQSLKLPPDSLESSRSGTPVVFTNGDATVTKHGPVDVDGKSHNEGEKNNDSRLETNGNQKKEEGEIQTKSTESLKSGKHDEPISLKCDNEVKGSDNDIRGQVNEELTKSDEGREKLHDGNGATGTPEKSDDTLVNSKHLVSPMGESSTIKNRSDVSDQNKIKIKTEADDTSSSDKLVLDEMEEGKTGDQGKCETKEEKLETKEEKCEAKEGICETKEEICETKEETKDIKSETKEETKEGNCETKEETKEVKCETKEETKEAKCEVKQETREETKEEKCETSEEAKCEVKQETKEEKSETKEETKEEKCEANEETKIEKWEAEEETKGEKFETKGDRKEENLKRKDVTPLRMDGVDSVITLVDQVTSKEVLKESGEKNIVNKSKMNDSMKDTGGVDSKTSSLDPENIPAIASFENVEKDTLKKDNLVKEDGEKCETLPKKAKEDCDERENETNTTNREECLNKNTENVKLQNKNVEENVEENEEETRVTSEENGVKQDSTLETDGAKKCCESKTNEMINNDAEDGEVEKHNMVDETASNEKDGIMEENDCNDKKNQCNSEEVKDPTDCVVKTGKKNKRERKKKTAKDVESRSVQEDVTEVRWSRRLRERKPPPPKDEVIVKPKKPQKLEKNTNVHHEKQKEKKKKKQDKEGHEKEAEERYEEEEEIESEEKDNSSDEDFILNSKNSTNDSAAAAAAPVPVKKARTATSKKKSKHSKKIEPELSDEPCIKCGNYNHPDQILLCDSCDAGYHTACLRPPLMFVPDGEWFCPACEHVALLKNLEVTLEVVDSELKIIRQKNRKKQDKFKWLLTEVCPANILPEDSSVLITKKIERTEKPERPRHERTRPKPRKVLRTYIEEPDEIEYIQRRSGRNRKQISYKFEEFDSAINSAISEEVEQKKIAIAQGDHIVYGQSRGKDMSTIEAAHWEEEEMARKERNARKRKKKLNDLDATSDEEEEEDQSDDEFKVNNDSCSDEDFIAEDDEPSVSEEEDEEEEEFSGQSDSGSEYGGRKRKRPSKRRGSRKDEGPVRRSSRNLGKERQLYHDTSSSESDDDRPRDAWRMNPIITARRQLLDEDDEDHWDHRRRKARHSSSDSGKDPSYGAPKKKQGHSTRSDPCERKKKRRKQQSSSSEEEEDGYVQPKRKFRIDSDESDESEAEVNKESDGGAVEDRLKVQRNTVKKTLRGMHTRVDYRKMADGSSSEDEAGSTGEQRREDEREGTIDLQDGDVKGSNSEKALIAENVRTGAKLNQNNSALVDDDDSLSPISDIEDLKENDVPQPEKGAAITMERTDKKSAEDEDDDDDDLEGVTDIFDYLSKD